MQPHSNKRDDRFTSQTGNRNRGGGEPEFRRSSTRADPNESYRRERSRDRFSNDPPSGGGHRGQRNNPNSNDWRFDHQQYDPRQGGDFAGGPPPPYGGSQQGSDPPGSQYGYPQQQQPSPMIGGMGGGPPPPPPPPRAGVTPGLSAPNMNAYIGGVASQMQPGGPQQANIYGQQQQQQQPPQQLFVSQQGTGANLPPQSSSSTSSYYGQQQPQQYSPSPYSNPLGDGRQGLQQQQPPQQQSYVTGNALQQVPVPGYPQQQEQQGWANSGLSSASYGTPAPALGGSLVDILGIADKAASAVQALQSQNQLQQSLQQQIPPQSFIPQQQQQSIQPLQQQQQQSYQMQQPPPQQQQQQSQQPYQMQLHQHDQSQYGAYSAPSTAPISTNPGLQYTSQQAPQQFLQSQPPMGNAGQQPYAPHQQPNQYEQPPPQHSQPHKSQGQRRRTTASMAELSISVQYAVQVSCVGCFIVGLSAFVQQYLSYSMYASNLIFVCLSFCSTGRTSKPRIKSKVPLTTGCWEWSKICQRAWLCKLSRNSPQLTSVLCEARLPIWPASCVENWRKLIDDETDDSKSVYPPKKSN